MKLRLVPQLSQKLIMTPQLQQAIKLLQLSRLELQQSLTQHLLENPLLDEIQSDVDKAPYVCLPGYLEKQSGRAHQTRRRPTKSEL